ncbi:hypothetical protein [Francisella philomiragia]|uniref:hypothetical protein n=1 Tax=Francisella philomiragia TaxID=28110 RepID=UPI001B8BA9B8|nr:hypothetical protein [Francisella philomiragia]QUE32165.1 hypothetical protein IMS64_03945 [Francisella philomiragia]
MSEINSLNKKLNKIIIETNGLSIFNTLELLSYENLDEHESQCLQDFIKKLKLFNNDELDIEDLLNHPIGIAFYDFLKSFPLKYHEEHIHLTGSLSAEFIYTRLKKLLDGKNGNIYSQKIVNIYGENALPINSVEDVEKLIVLKDGEKFSRYLDLLYLAKIILNTKQDHIDAAYHMASELYHKYNVGSIRLKFTLSRSTSDEKEAILNEDLATEEDVVLGLYEGFEKFKEEYPDFGYVLSPSFRKEANFFDATKFKTKKESFEYQVNCLIDILEKYPFLQNVMKDIDTVGDEKNIYKKAHFETLKQGIRKLQYYGFKIRSHHGETFHTLKKGVQAVDNALNIWNIDTLEHGLSIGINPNYYFQRLLQKVLKLNQNSQPLDDKSMEYREIQEIHWNENNSSIRDKITNGIKLNSDEILEFTKIKFHTAIEIERYQHDVLNRIISKNIGVVGLPSSNLKLTTAIPDYKDHPFSWWEKKGIKLGIGTDNYITLDTNYIREMLIILFSDAHNLKITKLLMVACKENRRAYISSLLWKMNKK